MSGTTSTPVSAFTAEMQSALSALGNGTIAEPDVMMAAVVAAKNYGIPLPEARLWADAELKKLRAPPLSSPPPMLPAYAVEVQPSPNPDPLEWILHLIITVISERIFCMPEVALVVALWCIATWGMPTADDPGIGPDLFPRLSITAPTKRCGKSLLLEIVEFCVRRALASIDISAAALFRITQKHRPTFVLDEADLLFRKSPDLESIGNGGYTRSGSVTRTREIVVKGAKDFEEVHFAIYAAMATAGIGLRRSTFEDRALHAPLQRQPQDRVGRRFGRKNLELLRDRIAPSLAAHAPLIAAAMAAGVPEHEIPRELHDRDGDNYRPMLALAKLISPQSLADTQAAAIVLCATAASAATGNEHVLGQVIAIINQRRRTTCDGYRTWVRAGRKTVRPLPGQAGVQRGSPTVFISSDDLAAALMQIDDAGFADVHDVGTAKQRLARALKVFDIKPEQQWHQGGPQRGYNVRVLRAVWRRYR